MKKMTIAGGFGGFSLGILGGIMTQGSSWPAIFLRASVAAVLCALLLRWWTGVLARCLTQARAERRAALAASKPPPASPFIR